MFELPGWLPEILASSYSRFCGVAPFYSHWADLGNRTLWKRRDVTTRPGHKTHGNSHLADGGATLPWAALQRGLSSEAPRLFVISQHQRGRHGSEPF